MDGLLSPEERLRLAGTTFEHFAPDNKADQDAKDASKTEPLPLLWFSEIKPVLEANDIVQNLLGKKTLAVEYGESNAGKTFLATDMALHVAAGMWWHGRRVEQGGVIYCVLEGGTGFRNRVVAWGRRHGLEGQDIPFAAIPYSMNLLDPGADTPRLIQAIKAVAERLSMPVTLVVIDTLSRAMAGGDENSSEDMTTLVNNMDRVRAETDATCLFIHHCGKDVARGARGHSSLRAAVDTEIEVRAEEEAGIKTATVVKQRDKKKGDVLGFRLSVEVLGQNEYGEDVTTCVVEPMEEAGTVKPKGKTQSLTPKEQGWLKDITNAFAEPDAARRLSPMPGMGPVQTLTRDQVREALKRRGRFKLDGETLTAPLTGADRNSLHSMLNQLKDKEKIGFTGDFVWLL